mmetsp:Transcript_22796/g.57988  ORF Transcript_22796/g.57988 Transcript_22796/m.57988 type:complete len:122 (-) Transcript_22796:720-1085(-)
MRDASGGRCKRAVEDWRWRRRHEQRSASSGTVAVVVLSASSGVEKMAAATSTAASEQACGISDENKPEPSSMQASLTGALGVLAVAAGRQQLPAGTQSCANNKGGEPVWMQLPGVTRYSGI